MQKPACSCIIISIPLHTSTNSNWINQRSLLAKGYHVATHPICLFTTMSIQGQAETEDCSGCRRAWLLPRTILNPRSFHSLPLPHHRCASLTARAAEPTKILWTQPTTPPRRRLFPFILYVRSLKIPFPPDLTITWFSTTAHPTLCRPYHRLGFSVIMASSLRRVFSLGANRTAILRWVS